MIDAIMDRLRALDEIVTVDTAAAYAALEAPPPTARCPAAYVIELADEASENGIATGGVRQRLSERFGIVLVLSSLRDRRGAAAQAALRPVRVAVRGALLGWQPDEAHDAITYVSGALVGAERSYVVWQDQYVTRSILRGP